MANEVQEYTRDDGVSDCGILAQRILQFKLDKIIPLIKTKIEQMNDFFMESYQGLFCALCDAKSHTLIDTEKKTITFGEKFCRQIVAKSMHSVIYLQVHFKRIAALSLGLVTMCARSGDYLSAETVPEAVKIPLQDTEKKLITSCRTYRNDPEWLEYCSPICDNFHPAKYSEYFVPSLDKYHKATLYLQSRYNALGYETEKKDEGQNAEIENKIRILTALRHHRRRKNRLLNNEAQKELNEELQEEEDEKAKEDGEGPKEPTVKELEKRFEDLVIIQKLPDAEIDITKFKSNYDEPGIELHDYGMSMVLTDEAYEETKKLIEQAQSAEVAAKKGGDSGGEGEQGVESREGVRIMLINFWFMVLAVSFAFL